MRKFLHLPYPRARPHTKLYAFIGFFLILLLHRQLAFFFASFALFELCFACVADVDIFSFHSFSSIQTKKKLEKRKKERIHTTRAITTHREKAKKYSNERIKNCIPKTRIGINTQVWKRLRHNRVRMFCICAHFNTCNSRNRSFKQRLSQARQAWHSMARQIQRSKPKSPENMANRCCCHWRFDPIGNDDDDDEDGSDEAAKHFLVLANFYLHVCKAINVGMLKRHFWLPRVHCGYIAAACERKQTVQRNK